MFWNLNVLSINLIRTDAITTNTETTAENGDANVPTTNFVML